MTKSELRRLAKIERRILKIASDELGLSFCPVEFDIVPPQKMLEIMAYHIPTNVSNWKRGRDYERWRTVYDNSPQYSLPYEVVIHSNPARAYLMNTNVFAVHCLVMAHVMGHVSFFTANKFFQKSRQDIVPMMYEASQRVNDYERRFGVDEVEKTIDAVHALQMHSNPFDPKQTEQERRVKAFEREKKKLYSTGKGDFADLNGQNELMKEDMELAYQRLWKELCLKTPIEPTSDIIAYIIDNSKVLQDWQKDILEVLRMEGLYYWPIVKTRFMNEGFATICHTKIMRTLFREGLLSNAEHADYNYANSLVKGMSIFSLNPYSVGCGLWEDIEERWNKGQYGSEWENCADAVGKESWDTGEMSGWGKCREVAEMYTDWFFMHDFLLPEAVRKLNIYVYSRVETQQTYDYTITKDEAEDIRGKVLDSFLFQLTPDIQVIDGNYEQRGAMQLKHNWNGIDLDPDYAAKTLLHIDYLWGSPVLLDSKEKDPNSNIRWRVDKGGLSTSRPGMDRYDWSECCTY